MFSKSRYTPAGTEIKSSGSSSVEFSPFSPQEIFFIRHALLDQSLTEAGVRDDLKQRWLEHDFGFKRALVKNSVDECEGRYKNEPIIVVKKPA